MLRSRKSQSKHDAKVRSIARKLENQGFNVRADIPGYLQPNTIRGFRPDVVGIKGRQRKIYEVETQDSVDSARDQKQQRAFRQAAEKSKNTTFKRTIT
jgi:peptidoglycan hydrolase-like protein with peptidoglycan-binding domain